LSLFLKIAYSKSYIFTKNKFTLKKYLYFLLSITCIFLWSSCRKDFDFEPARAGQISFSSDTIFLDTIFTRTQSSTKVLTVRNNSDDDISIDSVKLRRGISSLYQLNVDGLPNDNSPLTEESGKIFRDVEILANDSIFVFIEATVNLEDSDDLLDTDNNYLDEVNFFTSDSRQEVQLSTQVIDANFSFNENPSKEFITDQRDQEGEFIVLRGYDLTDEELTITRNKAQVIFGYAVVPSGKTLTISAGSRIHFHRDSGLIVEDGAMLDIIGEESPMDEDNPFLNEVIIEGDQIDEDFDNLPAQWNFIWIRKGGVAKLRNTIIKNATTGIFIEGNGNESIANVTLTNVQIYNSQTVGIQANASFIRGNNVVINQNGRSAINIEEGGTYEFIHTTLSNTFSFGVPSSTAIVLDNSPKENSSVVTTNLNASFINSIISGNKRSEITAINSDQASLDLSFENCLIDLNSSNTSDLDTNDAAIFTNCIFNENPQFKNTNLNMLQIENESPADGKARFIAGKDIIGTERTNPSDIGAYESITFKKEEDKN